MDDMKEESLDKKEETLDKVEATEEAIENEETQKTEAQESQDGGGEATDDGLSEAESLHEEDRNQIEDLYRILLQRDSETGKMVAQVPELPDCKVEEDSYEEALQAAREKIADVLAELRAEGKRVPSPIDERSYEPTLEVEVSPWLQRELEWQATNEKIEKHQLVSEILAEGLAQRKWRRRGQGRNQGKDGGRRPRRDHINKNKYMDIMEDRASFIEYVRGLDSGGSGGSGGGGGRRSGRGGGKRRR